MKESGPEHIARLKAERDAPTQPKVRVDVDTVPEQKAQENATPVVDAEQAKKDARNAKRRETAKAKKEQGK